MTIITKPDNAEQFSPEGSTVPFFKYMIDETQIVEFDTSMTAPPEPMVNAMIGLSMVDANTKLLMVNHKKPGGLLNKVGENYDYEAIDKADGCIQLLFSYKQGKSEEADLSNNKCDG